MLCSFQAAKAAKAGQSAWHTSSGACQILVPHIAGFTLPSSFAVQRCSELQKKEKSSCEAAALGVWRSYEKYRHR